jgi:hypothetical protein
MEHTLKEQNKKNTQSIFDGVSRKCYIGAVLGMFIVCICTMKFIRNLFLSFVLFSGSGHAQGIYGGIDLSGSVRTLFSEEIQRCLCAEFSISMGDALTTDEITNLIINKWLKTIKDNETGKVVISE